MAYTIRRSTVIEPRHTVHAQAPAENKAIKRNRKAPLKMNVRLSNVTGGCPKTNVIPTKDKRHSGRAHKYTEATGGPSKTHRRGVYVAILKAPGASNKQLSDKTHATTATGYCACRRQQLGQETCDTTRECT